MALELDLQRADFGVAEAGLELAGQGQRLRIALGPDQRRELGETGLRGERSVGEALEVLGVAAELEQRVLRGLR